MIKYQSELQDLSMGNEVSISELTKIIFFELNLELIYTKMII